MLSLFESFLERVEDDEDDLDEELRLRTRLTRSRKAMVATKERRDVGAKVRRAQRSRVGCSGRQVSRVRRLLGGAD